MKHTSPLWVVLLVGMIAYVLLTASAIGLAYHMING